MLIKLKELFTCKEKNNNKNRIPQTMKYNKKIPNKFKFVKRKWKILQVITNSTEYFNPHR